MKFFWALAIGLLLSQTANAAEECYRLGDEPKEITIGWFSPQTFTADSFCIKGNYRKMGFVPNQFMTFKFGNLVLVQYTITTERYSDTDIRITVHDNEPEPTQFDVEFNDRMNVMTGITFADYIYPIDNGRNFACKAENGMSLTLKQIDDTTAFELAVKDSSGVTFVNSVLRIVTEEDVHFFLENTDDDITYKIYMDEMYQTYLTLPGATDSIDFNCEE